MEYNLFQTIDIWWHGRIQRILYDIPFIKPGQEGNKAPEWFRDVYSSWYWTYYLDADKRPTHRWLKNYWHASKRLVETWLDRLKRDAKNEAVALVEVFTGKPKQGYRTLSDWLGFVWGQVKYSLPDWINNLAADVAAVYNDLKNWARARYDAALGKVATLWTWLETTGAALRRFYDDTHTWVSNFIQNPAGVILGVLGDTWAKLKTFDQGALSYFYNLWGSYRETLADFIADPLGFLYDRAEQYLVDKW